MIEEYEFIFSLRNYDPSYVVEYFNEWNSYEEYGWKGILSKNNKFYIISGGYSPMMDCGREEVFSPEEISEEEAIKEMMEFEEIVNL